MGSCGRASGQALHYAGGFVPALYKDPAYEAASFRSIVDPKRNAKVNNHRERVSYKQNLVRAAGDCHVERAGPFQP